MRGLPSLHTCVLCGTCTCRPQDEVLIQHQGLYEQRDFIHEDNVTWLGQYRLIVACALGDQAYPFAATKDAFVTGLVRRRGSHTSQDQRREFARGNAIDVNFGAGTKIVRGEGIYEVVSVPENSMTAHQVEQKRVFLAIHEKCLVILNLAQIFRGQVDTKISVNNLVVDFLPETVDQLLLASKYQQKAHCSAENAWAGGAGCSKEEKPLKMPKVYFLDPLVEDHISRLRSFLQINHRPSMGSDKYNSHLDKWQRALLLEKKSYQGDPLSLWPTEILMHIASFLSAREVGMLCYASNAAAWKLNQAGFWFQRLKSDMPWLWDVTIERVLQEQYSAHGFQAATNIDWQAIYFDLKEQSIYESRKRTLSLVNRKRIWYICQSLFQQVEKAQIS